MTLIWSIPRAPLAWAERPGDVPAWDLSPSHLWGGFGALEPGGGDINGATAFLTASLADGPRSARIVKAAAAQWGIKPTTLERAKKRLGVVSVREGAEGQGRGGGRWLWKLCEKPSTSDNIQDHQSKGDDNLKRSHRRNFGDAVQAPPLLPENYPRLVRCLERGVNYGFAPELELLDGRGKGEKPEKIHAFELIARLAPDAFAGTVIGYEAELERKLRGEAENAPPAFKVKKEPIRAFAEMHGLLVHPKFGDALFGWALVALEFQLTLALWAAASLPSLDKDDPAGYPLAIGRILSRRERSSFQVGEHTHRLFRLELPTPLFTPETADYDSERGPEDRLRLTPAKLIPAGMLRRELLGALQTRFNEAFGRHGQSQMYLYFDHGKEARGLHPGEDVSPFLGVKAGLYACGLYQLLGALGRGPQLRACKGCGRLFVPRRSNQMHCPSSAESCRQRAARKRKKGRTQG